jgi:DNA-binding transcriptional MerR regulator
VIAGCPAAQASVKTLRYYDELRPAETRSNRPRVRLSPSRLPRLHRILALKDLGFPLDQVAEALDEGLSADALRGMLMLRRAEQEEQLREKSERLTRLKALLRLIEQAGICVGDVSTRS